ncbi:hypothetical protein [Occallatibacter riparius]|uniref:Uncharacterized protein n=1 Tax=Occallatibacter riparius TaxID=1002689 RepID=A0A9J7BT60_9BACT|nr:hypothetical protein [Occallatibacter riparius]UWZ84930.1 hypothetical protein MOP44_03080 [Occallatibacter riparius]
MKKQFGAAVKRSFDRALGYVLVAGLATGLVWGAGAAAAQENPQTAPPGQTPAAPAKPGLQKRPSQSSGQSAAQSSGQDSADTKKPEKRITPDEAKELFALVDQLMQFSSEETGLPVKSQVKRQLTSRAEVESYLKEKFDEDESAKRMQRGEIVLKKFGLLDHDFDLKPFLLDLLKEQIEAYYDSKTKTVNMLDWVDVEEQKPVLAHELTHALQDQHVDLEKWGDQTPDEVSTDYKDDIDHLSKDEMDTAREAVTEGQATAVMMDNILKPMGKSLIKDPEVVEYIKHQMVGTSDSPVMARAPLLLSESLLFPYREGLSFVQDVWMDKGQGQAFAGALDRPPSSTWEIINPREFEKAKIPMVPLMPDIHPLLDKVYKPYDIGQVGELDLHILTQLFGGESAARDLTPAWDGGIYWAGQRLSAKTPAEQASTKSISLFYLSAWKSNEAATAFAQLYAKSLGRKYSGLKKDVAAQRTLPAEAPSGTVEQVFTTDEGPVTITTRGKLVMVAESFDLPMARKLTQMVLDAQGTGDMRQARMIKPVLPGAPDRGMRTLSGGFVKLFAESGVMKAAVAPAVRLAAPSTPF